ncbi:MAG: hypothetical protein HY918_03975 [Candidatus Doudnabacteria bacterium]|nr:hypothetical protein [Candidatus Doudnabacteria bacterium]
MPNNYRLKDFDGTNASFQDVVSYFEAVHQVSPRLRKPGRRPQLLHELRLAGGQLKEIRTSDRLRGDGFSLSEAKAINPDEVRVTLVHEFMGAPLRTASVTYHRILVNLV